LTVHEERPSDSSSAGNEGKAPLTQGSGRKRERIISILFFAFFLLLWLILYLLNRELFYSGNHIEAGEPQFSIVQIKSGSSVAEIGATLASQGLIASELVFKGTAAIRGKARSLKAGEYRFDRSMSLLDILSFLEQGRVMLHKFTIPEGSTVEHIAELLAREGLADPRQILALGADERFCSELGFDGPILEGFLFPETYKIAKGLPAKHVVRIMVDRFWRVWSSETKERPDADKINLREIISIASIIEKEAIYDDEELLVSSVIYNRLDLAMPLQCDVTIRYPLDNYGADLTYADLHLDSPYNSYLYRGLPPTPICNPGLTAIRAALNPPKTDYLYFVSMNNGRHKFSTNLRDHNEAVYKYQVLKECGEEGEDENAEEQKS
jgi:UPF0755 protein